MSKRSRDNTVRPWAAEKLEALRRALDYYTTYLKNQHYWQKVYVDAFAGPSLSVVRTRPVETQKPVCQQTGDLFGGMLITDTQDPVEEEVRYLKGSPRVALDLKNPFDRYIFIEKNPERVAELEAMRQQYGESRQMQIHAGDANQVLLDMLAAGFSKKTHRAYIFLDPFGIQVPWSTIAALAATKAIEIIINFPMGMAIRRMMPRSGDVPKGWSMSLHTFFGTQDWRQHVYHEADDLIGPRTQKFADSEERLLEWYRSRLETAFGFVSAPKLITNTRGGRLYYLIWAGPRAEGMKGADYIMKMKKPRRTYRGQHHP